MSDFIWDDNREGRTGVCETVFCEGKTPAQVRSILQFHLKRSCQVLLTRMSLALYENLHQEFGDALVYFEQGRIAFFCYQPTSSCDVKNSKSQPDDIAIITAGTSDISVAIEAQKTLEFNTIHAPLICDVGVAGINRLLSRLEDIKRYKILIAVAGMEGALFSVLAGLVKAPVIAVPSSIGYGVSEGGKAALSSALSSCAPGVLTVNINNGFGAATAAIKMLNSIRSNINV